MKFGYWLIIGLGSVLPAWGSPISVPIDSLEMLDQLRIRIEHEEFDGIANDGPVISVKMSWQPVPEDKDFPPRFDLILFRSTGGRRMWTITRPNAEGVCVSEFAISKSDAENAQLVFSNGQNVVHGFSLADFLEGFPDPRLGFGVPSSTERGKSAEQDADDQAPARAESKAE